MAYFYNTSSDFQSHIEIIEQSIRLETGKTSKSLGVLHFFGNKKPYRC